MDPKLRIVCDELEKGTFGKPVDYEGLISALTTGGDYYLVSDDFSSYLATQDLVDEAYKDKDEWATKSITSAANMGFFSADRCINEYITQSQFLYLLNTPANRSPGMPI
jgi:starch phosphorylase